MKYKYYIIVLTRLLEKRVQNCDDAVEVLKHHNQMRPVGNDELRHKMLIHLPSLLKNFLFERSGIIKIVFSDVFRLNIIHITK